MINYLKAIDIATALNSDDDWSYCAEIDATSKLARIAVYDQDGIKLGYLGEFNIIKSEVVA